jgi:hypothetical protein
MMLSTTKVWMMRSSATAARSSLVLSRAVAASVIDAKSALIASMLTRLVSVFTIFRAEAVNQWRDAVAAA